MSVIMSRRRIVQPSGSVVSLATMQQHLNLDTEGSPPAHPDDDLIMQYVAAATNDLEGEDGWLGRALMPQKWRITYRCFPRQTERNPDGAIFLPYPPLLSVDRVAYVNTGGTTIEMTEGIDYTVNADGNPHAWIAAPFLGTWPVAADTMSAVIVEFQCGYDDTASPPNPIPDAIKHYVMVLAALMYEHRELDVSNVNIQPIENYHAAAQRLRVYGP